MSVTFLATRLVDGRREPLFHCHCTDWCDACQERELNLSNVNARDLLDWLELSVSDDLYGTVTAHDLAARCRRRLWNEPRNHDQGFEGYIDEQTGRCTVVMGGRPDGYLRQRTKRLLQIAELSGDHDVSWG